MVERRQSRQSRLHLLALPLLHQHRIGIVSPFPVPSGFARLLGIDLHHHRSCRALADMIEKTVPQDLVAEHCWDPIGQAIVDYGYWFERLLASPSGEESAMWHIHPNARTTPAVRAEIAGSQERTGVLAQRYGVSTETIRKGRQRGVEDCWDYSARPQQLPWKATEEERAVVCALRRSTNFALDDLALVVHQTFAEAKDQ